MTGRRLGIMAHCEAETVVGRRKTGQNDAMRQIGKSLLRSNAFQSSASALIDGWLRLTWHLNREVAESADHRDVIGDDWPVILALWHGQQLLAPYAAPKEQNFVSLVSRSADAEINARVIRRNGHAVVRGSGGRDRQAAAHKGAVSATLALCNALREGTSVVMIADISKGEPRKAGEGIVRLARMSGRPIVPMAIGTSRYHVIEKAWDKTTINLPFGRRCLKLGDPIYVPADADDAMLQAKREEVTEVMNRITAEAYRAVEGGA